MNIAELWQSYSGTPTVTVATDRHGSGRVVIEIDGGYHPDMAADMARWHAEQLNRAGLPTALDVNLLERPNR